MLLLLLMVLLLLLHVALLLLLLVLLFLQNHARGRRGSRRCSCCCGHKGRSRQSTGWRLIVKAAVLRMVLLVWWRHATAHGQVMTGRSTDGRHVAPRVKRRGY